MNFSSCFLFFSSKNQKKNKVFFFLVFWLCKLEKRKKENRWSAVSFIYPPKPGHFSRTLAKGPNTTTWIWNLHADAHDFDSHTSDLEEISRKVFSAHFGQLGVIFIWLSGGETNLLKQKSYLFLS
jgi:hypothetical protein